MNTKKIAAGILSMAILISSTAGVFAQSVENASDELSNEEVIPISLELGAERQLFYMQFRGTVKEITDYKAIDGAKFISVESSTGRPANIIVDKDTYVLDNEEIKVGSEITAYYDANANMIMIYPPQYKAEAIVVESDSRNVRIDRFGKELVSADNTLKLMNISEDTIITSVNGATYEGELEDMVLAVVYGASTRSIPAQTTPERIVVISKADISAELPIDEVVAPSVGVSGSDLFVDGIKIDSPEAFISKAGVQMIPLRAAAEALGYDVTWNGSERSVSLGGNIKLVIGKDSFLFEGAEIELAEASLIIDGRTFVPIGFFDALK